MPADLSQETNLPKPIYPLGRLVEFDLRSLANPVRPLTAGLGRFLVAPVTKFWNCPVHLDQLSEGSCVGHAWAHRLIAEPYNLPLTHEEALRIYKLAQTFDQWPGEAYEGTSVIGGVKALEFLSIASGVPIVPVPTPPITGYKWAFGLEDVLQTLSYIGPVVLGIPWYSSMYTPDSKGFIHVAGSKSGGHAILAKGISVETETVTLHNSWGESWGQKGDCVIAWKDLQKLLKDDGEACVVSPTLDPAPSVELPINI